MQTDLKLRVLWLWSKHGWNYRQEPQHQHLHQSGTPLVFSKHISGIWLTVGPYPKIAEN